MYNYDINKCHYQHKPKYIHPFMKKELIARNKSNYCLDMVLEYKGNTINNIIKKGLSIKEKYCLLIQLLYAVDTLHSNGYLHADIHIGNILYQKIKTHQLKIYGKILPCKFQYSLIDYGSVCHVKYDMTQKRKKYTLDLLQKNYDVSYHINHNIILQNSILYESSIEEKKQLPKITRKKILLLFYKNQTIWNKIKNILYNDNKEWFNLYEKKQMINEHWD